MRKQYGDAGRLYDAAVRMAPKEVASHETTWRQACRLMQKLKLTADETLCRSRFLRTPA